MFAAIKMLFVYVTLGSIAGIVGVPGLVCDSQDWLALLGGDAHHAGGNRRGGASK